MKNNRQQAILQIITSTDVETQDMLLQKLLEKGYSVTQATVSRDIKKMGLVKEADPSGKYRYICHKTELPQQSAKYVNILKETMTDIVNANNLVVIKTYPGMANAAAAAFDTIFMIRYLLPQPLLRLQPHLHNRLRKSLNNGVLYA